MSGFALAERKHRDAAAEDRHAPADGHRHVVRPHEHVIPEIDARRLAHGDHAQEDRRNERESFRHRVSLFQSFSHLVFLFCFKGAQHHPPAGLVKPARDQMRRLF